MIELVMENKEAKVYYYPYCGYRIGWCISKEPCKACFSDRMTCKYFEACHPITKLQPNMLPDDTKKWMDSLVNTKRNDN